MTLAPAITRDLMLKQLAQAVVAQLQADAFTVTSVNLDVREDGKATLMVEFGEVTPPHQRMEA